MKKKNQTVTRRDFLKETAGGAGIIALGSGSFAASIGLGRAATAGKDANPFAYDVERLRKTDPKLIQYEQVGSFRSPHEDSRRIAIGPDDRVYIAASNYVSVLDHDGSRIADVANCGPSRHAGAITAGLFLQRFVPAAIPWLHLDLYAWNDADRPGRPQGGEAQGLRAMFAALKTRYSHA